MIKIKRLKASVDHLPVWYQYEFRDERGDRIVVYSAKKYKLKQVTNHLRHIEGYTFRVLDWAFEKSKTHFKDIWRELNNL